MNMNPATESIKRAQVPFFLPPPQRRRWLLWLARRCYFWFLRANRWKCVLSPSPLKGGGLMLKWQKQIGGQRFLLTTEEALLTESRLHATRQRREAAEPERSTLNPDSGRG